MSSELGNTIDLPFEDFKKSIIEQKVSLGVLQNMRIMFTSSFNELVNRKDALLEKLKGDELDRAEVISVIQGIYAEMTKIEQKCLFLTERIEELKPLKDI